MLTAATRALTPLTEGYFSMPNALLKRAALAAALMLACAPPALAAGGIGPITTAAPATSMVLCATACDLLDFHVTTSVAGYLILVDSASAPGAGALSGRLVGCIYLPSAPGTASYSTAGMPPVRVLTGLVFLFSTTGCRTYTASSSAEMFGRVQ